MNGAMCISKLERTIVCERRGRGTERRTGRQASSAPRDVGLQVPASIFFIEGGDV